MTPYAFIRDGFVVLHQAISVDAVSRLRVKADLFRKRAEQLTPSGIRIAPQCGEQARADVNGIGGYTWGLNEITRPGWHDPELFSTFANPHLLDTIHALIPRPRAWGMKMLWAPRLCDYRLGWHRDLPMDLEPFIGLRPAYQDHLQFNIALTTDPSFHVVPGSHRRARTPIEQQLIAANNLTELPGALSVPLAAGDILVMDALTLHRGGVQAGAPRLTLHGSVQSDATPLVPWNDDRLAHLTSDDFLDSLPDTLLPWYERLQQAPHHTGNPYALLFGVNELTGKNVSPQP